MQCLVGPQADNAIVVTRAHVFVNARIKGEEDSVTGSTRVMNLWLVSSSLRFDKRMRCGVISTVWVVAARRRSDTVRIFLHKYNVFAGLGTGRIPSGQVRCRLCSCLKQLPEWSTSRTILRVRSHQRTDLGATWRAYPIQEIRAA